MNSMVRKIKHKSAMAPGEGPGTRGAKRERTAKRSELKLS